MNVLKEDK